ncbi:MAG: lipoyl synthase [Sulfuricurvum sp.]|uniref:lipoyl synthase n=1 Tax=Sulfuricurvum sp. TaxID=2025608 RepID=UPI002608B5F9|nr:lipoyl synthase [Sulfuricurvum sp.]MDD5160600.1 lipoyl synthase [Sulfuricurvum sp.]
MQKPFKPKPKWLRKKILLSSLNEVESLLDQGKVHTVCQEAMCPNIGECFTQRVATFMLLGTHCTRACTFCTVSKGKPTAPDRDEPVQVAETIKKLGLKHVVITSVTRDDLSDGGAGHFCETVHAIKALDKSISIELLIPDLHENEVALKQIALSGAEIIGHNMETVPRLYHIRRGAEYDRSLRVLEKLHLFNPSIATKSGIMLGLGEREDEVLELMKDLLGVGCRLLSIGQYLSPSAEHSEVVEYVDPKQFDQLRRIGREMGFNYIKSSPYTRSSYMAHEYLISGSSY